MRTVERKTTPLTENGLRLGTETADNASSVASFTRDVSTNRTDRDIHAYDAMRNKRIAESTQKVYRYKILKLVDILRKKAKRAQRAQRAGESNEYEIYLNALNESGQLNLPLSWMAVKGLFGYLTRSTSMTKRRKRRRGQHGDIDADDDSSDESDSDDGEHMVEEASSSTANNVKHQTLSVGALQG